MKQKLDMPEKNVGKFMKIIFQVYIIGFCMYFHNLQRLISKTMRKSIDAKNWGIIMLKSMLVEKVLKPCTWLAGRTSANQSDEALLENQSYFPNMKICWVISITYQ